MRACVQDLSLSCGVLFPGAYICHEYYLFGALCDSYSLVHFFLSFFFRLLYRLLIADILAGVSQISVYEQVR